MEEKNIDSIATIDGFLTSSYMEKVRSFHIFELGEEYNKTSFTRLLLHNFLKDCHIQRNPISKILLQLSVFEVISGLQIFFLRKQGLEQTQPEEAFLPKVPSSYGAMEH